MKIDINQILSNPELAKMAANHLSYSLADVQTYDELTPKEREIISRDAFDKIVIAATETYNTIKQEHPGHIVLIRVGHFFVTYEDDADAISRTLGMTAEKRKASFPSHALDTYLPKLIRAGHKVAIFENA